jgi:hypothetical protein
MKAHHKTPWTAAEDAVLLAHPCLSNGAVAKMLPKRTRESCRHRRKLLGVGVRDQVARFKAWSEAEDAIIRANCHRTGSELADMLPGRSFKACQQRRRVLGFAAVKIVQGPATEAEDEIIRAHVGLGIRALHAKLPGRSESWIYTRRAELGLVRRRRDSREAIEAAPVESQAKRLEPEGTAYRTASGQPARIINRFPMPDVPSVYGP